MVFLIEGIDGCGKTTAIANVRKMLPDVTYIKESYPGDSPRIREERLATLKSRTNSYSVAVYDRTTVLDDFIYEPIIGGRESTLVWEEVRPILHRCLTVYFTCDPSVVVGRLEGRGDEYIADTGTSLFQVLSNIKERYDRYISQIPHITIDVTRMSESQISSALFDVILNASNLYPKKRPKLAHIVPRDLLHVTSNNQYHMCLAHLIDSDDEYLAFYRRMVAAGRYVLMDNGAAENSQLSLDKLYECWKALKPTELVLPDTLCDKDDTLMKTQTAIYSLRNRDVTCKFMAVPQGKTFEEWQDCAERLIKLPEVHTLGISKFLTIQLKDPDVRYRAVQSVSEMRKLYNRDDVEVHLLGCDVGPSEPGRVFKDFDFVRGCDTALAYIFAQSGKPIEVDAVRPDGEMSFIEDTLSSADALTEAIKQFNNISDVVNDFGDFTWM